MTLSISFFCDDLRAGGVQRTILLLAQAFQARGWRSELVLSRAVGDLMSDLPEKITLKSLNTRGYRRSVGPLTRYLKESNPTVLVAATPWGNTCALLASWRAGQGTKVLTTDVTDPHRAYGSGGGWRNRLIRAAARRLYPRAHGRIAVSSGVADAMVDLLSLERDLIRVIYNPIDLTRSGPAQPPVHPWLGQDRKGPVLVAAGRLHPVKDYPTLIGAIAALKSEGHPARLVVLGEGDERPRLEAMIEELGLNEEIALPGFSENVRGAMAAADGYVLCSRAEGLGNALIEALAEGTPVVSTDCPFGPREILANGEYGRLVPVGDVGALAGGIRAMLEDGRREVPSAALERFDLDRIISQYEALIGG